MFYNTGCKNMSSGVQGVLSRVEYELADKLKVIKNFGLTRVYEQEFMQN